MSSEPLRKTIQVNMSALRRHLSTIGMGDVFLQPPQSHLLPSAYCKGPEGGAFVTPEILGTIKTIPEDFVVREIASTAIFGDVIKDEHRIADLRTIVVDTAPSVDDVVPKADEAPFVAQQDDLEEILPPIEVVKRILQQNCPLEAEEVLASIQSLSATVKDQIQQRNTSTEGLHRIMVPPLTGESYCLGLYKRGGDRGSFHRALKRSFPLLKSQTAPKEETKPEEDPTVFVCVDVNFFSLIPYFYKPEESLGALYDFRSKGCPPPVEGDKQTSLKRKRMDNDWNSSIGDQKIILPFKPDLSKDQRREIHNFFSKNIRDFETATIHDYAIQDNGGADTKTSALVVKWSKHAKRVAVKKTKSSDHKETYTLCVMRKRQREHLVAINYLSKALRVRPADIGLAGIKDMQAITYQYITIKHKSPKEVSKANTILNQQGIELGSCQQVNECISTGSLDGNRFEIVIRDLQRIRVVEKDNGEVYENMISCDQAHLEERIDVIRQTGFINYFGEQRLGSPGETSEVGVRSFDIGRAMLQQNFDEAVNLLMTGRLVCCGPEEQESPMVRKVRETWKDSGGDASLTLAAMPKMEIMAREKAVLQGLKRSNDSLDAIKCLGFSVRMFWINAYQSYVWNTMASQRILRLGPNVVEGDLIVDEHGKIHLVDASNVTTAKFEEVVLPLPGYSVQYPQNEIGELYDTMLKKEKVCFDKDAPPEGTAKGGYRRLICRPDHVTADIMEEEKGNIMSVKLGFDLPSGTYATMLLREFMMTTVARR
jgi:tRNA pseudouridine13 synthase